MTTKNGISRRAVLAGAGGAAGAAALIGGGITPAFSAEPGLQSSSTADLVPAFTPTPQQAGLSYRYYSGYAWHALEGEVFTANGGNFVLLGTTPGYARCPLNLPTGAVIKEVEVLHQPQFCIRHNFG